MPDRPSSPSNPPAGWYPDPGGDGGHRYWDGDAWTAHVRSSAPDAPTPSAAPRFPAPPAGAPSVPGRTTPPGPGGPAPSYPPPPHPGPRPMGAAAPARPGRGGGPNWTIIGAVAVVAIAAIGAFALLGGGDGGGGGGDDNGTTAPTAPPSSDPGGGLPPGAQLFTDPDGRYTIAVDPAWDGPTTETDPEFGGTFTTWIVDPVTSSAVNVFAEASTSDTDLAVATEEIITGLESSLTSFELLSNEETSAPSGDGARLVEYRAVSQFGAAVQGIVFVAIGGEAGGAAVYASTTEDFATQRETVLAFLRTFDVA